MAQKTKKKWRTPPPVKPVDREAASDPLRDAGVIRRLLAEGKARAALDLARQHHARQTNADSEDLVVDCYVARILALVAQNMFQEGASLLDLARDRHPCHEAKFESLRLLLLMRRESLDSVLRLLTAEQPDSSVRDAVHQLIRCHLSDLSPLADSIVLPATHPLKVAADALRTAFSAVTSGPVAPEVLTLPEVSRRSPLAPWKSLILAIAACYQGDGDACRRHLEAVDAESRPGRLVPVVRNLLGDAEISLTTRGTALVGLIGGGATLKKALEALDSALADGRRSRILGCIEAALATCEREKPEILESLKQHIWAFCLTLDLSSRDMERATGGVPRPSAAFYHLCARALETKREAAPLEACMCWDKFRVCTLEESLFPPNGIEEAAVYRQMADQLTMIPNDQLDDAIRECLQACGVDLSSGRRGAPFVLPEDWWFLQPGRVFAKAASLDPHAETFEAWLKWSRQESEPKSAEVVAKAWHEALPQDVRPILSLMQGADERHAYKLALGYLEKAEQVDRLNPEVRRSRLRLMVNLTRRHLQRREFHLVEKDLAELEALPQARGGDVSAFPGILRWISLALQGKTREAIACFENASRSLGGPGALMMARGIAAECKLKEREMKRCLPVQKAGDAILTSMARACLLGDTVGLRVEILRGQTELVHKELERKPVDLESPLLIALAETALRQREKKLAYAATVPGLDRGDCDARFLLLRARSMPSGSRRTAALAAAAELGRRERNASVTAEAVDLIDDEANWFTGPSGPPPNLDEIQALLQEERSSRSYPAPGPRSSLSGLCTCGRCHLDDDDDIDFPDLEEVLESLFAPGKSNKRSSKRAPAPSFEQATLF